MASAFTAALALSIAMLAPAVTPDARADQGDGLVTDDHVGLALDLSTLATQGLFSTRFDQRLQGVVLATSERFPDALAGAALADRADTALLFTGPDRLDERVAAGLRKLVEHPSRDRGLYGEYTVWLLGGTGALSEQVAADVAAISDQLRVVRLAGPNRVATSLAVADEAIDLWDREACDGPGYQRPADAGDEPWWDLPPEPTCGHTQWRDMSDTDDNGEPRIFLNRYWPEVAPERIDVSIARAWGKAGDANGTSAWADSLAAASHLATRNDASGAPVDDPTAPVSALVLTPTAELDDAVAGWLRARAGELGRATLLGGPAALSPAVADEVAATGVPTRRVAGPNRIATSVALHLDATGDELDLHRRRTTNFPRHTQLWLVNGFDPRGWGLALAAVNGTPSIVWAAPDGLSDSHDGLLRGCWTDGLNRSWYAIGRDSLNVEVVARSLRQGGPADCGGTAWATEYEARYPACEPLRIRYNPTQAPSGMVAALEDAVAALNGASSGLQLDVVGQTDLRSANEADFELRHDAEATYGSSITVVSVAESWTAGSGTLATGGSLSRSLNGGTEYLIAGSVALQPDLSLPRDLLTGLLIHELGHVLGLGHVEGDQLMGDRYRAAAGLGAGDRQGVAYTTAGPC